MGAGRIGLLNLIFEKEPLSVAEQKAIEEQNHAKQKPLQDLDKKAEQITRSLLEDIRSKLPCKTRIVSEEIKTLQPIV